MTANGYRDSFSGDKIVLKLIVVMYAQFYTKYKKNPLTVHLNGCTIRYVNQ